MNRITWGLLALLFLLALLTGLADALTPQAQAGECHQAVTYSYGWKWYPAGYYGGTWYAAGWYKVYHAPAQHAPAYTISYDGDLATSLRIIEKLIDERKAAPAPQVQALALPPDGRAVLAASCLRCHSAERAPEKGDGFVIDPDRLTANDLKAIQRRVRSDDALKVMPPGKLGPLPKAEREAVLALKADAPAKPPAPMPKAE